jgi:hypothetical protein
LGGVGSPLVQVRGRTQSGAGVRGDSAGAGSSLGLTSRDASGKSAESDDGQGTRPREEKGVGGEEGSWRIGSIEEAPEPHRFNPFIRGGYRINVRGEGGGRGVDCVECVG